MQSTLRGRTLHKRMTIRRKGSLRTILEVTYCTHWRRQWQPTPALLPGKSHGWRSLVGCSPWGCEESDMTERLHFHFSLSCIGEGNGNPLQCSCLENPRDEGAWWAAVYAVAQSWTRLKWLSSSMIEKAIIQLTGGLRRQFLFFRNKDILCFWDSYFKKSLT